MAKRKAAASLGAFGVKPTSAPTDKKVITDTAEPEERTRAKGEKVGVMLRLNREDWYRLHDFANRQGVSLQKLIVTSLVQYMQEKGVNPITGR
jgi:hypothetical protein